MLRQRIHYQYLIKQGHSVSTMDIWTFIVSSCHRGETVTILATGKDGFGISKTQTRNSTHRSNPGDSIFGSQSAMTAKARGNLVPHFTENWDLFRVKSNNPQNGGSVGNHFDIVVKKRLEFATMAQHKSLTAHQQFNYRLTEHDASSNCTRE